MTLKTTGSSDQDLFELMHYYYENDILNQNEELLAKFREYLENRFDYMHRKMILKYCNFLKDLGMFGHCNKLVSFENAFWLRLFFH